MLVELQTAKLPEEDLSRLKLFLSRLLLKVHLKIVLLPRKLLNSSKSSWKYTSSILTHLQHVVSTSETVK